MSDHQDRQLKQHGKADGKIDRRDFFKALFSETVAFFDEIKGIPQLRLTNLWKMPDDRMVLIKPVIRTNVDIIPTEKKTSARFHGKKEHFILFDYEPPNIFVFNRFNGLTTIGQIGKELARAMSWNDEKGFAHARDLFLHLVHLKICLPGNPIE